MNGPQEDPEIKFVPLEGMTPEQVQEVLKEATKGGMPAILAGVARTKRLAVDHGIALHLCRQIVHLFVDHIEAPEIGCIHNSDPFLTVVGEVMSHITSFYQAGGEQGAVDSIEILKKLREMSEANPNIQKVIEASERGEKVEKIAENLSEEILKSFGHLGHKKHN